MVNDVIKELQANLEKGIEALKKDLGKVRTGRASVSILDGIRVDYYGTPTPLNQVGNLSAPEPTLITIQPWEPQLLPAIEKAIRASDLDLNPQNDGKLIRVPVPPLTDERRKSLVKHAHKLAEEGRVAVRNVRRDANDHLKKLLKDHDVGEDDEKHAIAEVQKLTDQHIDKITEILKKKEADILG
jgi:ribosome recycling factor